ncbi:helix-turn-helix transcriptional regulator [Streptomyces sp. OfavH-34-F]|uniref:helix-turn-helix domain-containing protein n=1 Tax=Streptomyces sp. OfavH-34-F TaxID=2917760 RepID=UPI001EF1C76D|nr:helix-turn-helix transcriptional regulator [Streptomyces sp. OfavH-34-F]MCG7524904.1 helix-turn-helix transcriptional regulator [Streptomyces sp. OfavH-34-F]
MKESKRRATTAHASQASTPAEFGRWLASRLETLGYDISGPRSGGRSKFAEASGLSPSTVGRLLKGDLPTDVRLLRTLAEAVRTPYPEILVRAGVLTSAELQAVQRPTAPPGGPLTPEQAADELGIDDPAERRVFVNLTETLRRTTTHDDGEQQLAD